MRLNPVVVSNVVTYAAIITAPNPEMELKPGMTANLTIEVARKDDVLRAPAAALRFRPTESLFTALGQDPAVLAKGPPSGTRAAGAGARAGGRHRVDVRRRVPRGAGDDRRDRRRQHGSHERGAARRDGARDARRRCRGRDEVPIVAVESADAAARSAAKVLAGFETSAGLTRLNSAGRRWSSSPLRSARFFVTRLAVAKRRLLA